MTDADTPRFTPDRFRAALAQLRLTLCGWLLVLASALRGTRAGRMLRAELLRDLRAMRAGVANVLGALAIPRLGALPPETRMTFRPAHVPRGCRRAPRDVSLRFMRRTLPKAYSLRGRIVALQRVLDNLDAWIARMAARLRQRGAGAATILCVAPCDVCVSRAHVAASAVDSS